MFVDPRDRLPAAEGSGTMIPVRQYSPDGGHHIYQYSRTAMIPRITVCDLCGQRTAHPARNELKVGKAAVPRKGNALTRVSGFGGNSPSRIAHHRQLTAIIDRQTLSGLTFRCHSLCGRSLRGAILIRRPLVQKLWRTGHACGELRKTRIIWLALNAFLAEQAFLTTCA